MCDVYAGLCNNLNFGVGYGDLFFIYYPDRMILVGGNTASLHGDNSWNHWMTTPSGIGIANAAADYINMYNPGGTICTNDEALPYGGKFDVFNDWTFPHRSHDRGTAVDIAKNFGGQCPAASVVAIPAEMLRFCVQEGAYPFPTSRVDPDDIHCNWANPATYPH